MFIPDLDFLPNLDPGQGQKGPGSRGRSRNTAFYKVFLVCTLIFLMGKNVIGTGTGTLDGDLVDFWDVAG